MCACCTKKLKQNLKFDTAVRFQRLAAVCDELGFDDEAAVYRKLLTDAGQPTVEVPDASNPLGLDKSMTGSGRFNSGAASAAGGQRALSNANTASRTNRLVGGAVNNKPAATNQRPGRQAAAANPVFRNAANNSLSPKLSKATGKAVPPKPKAGA